MPVSTSRAAVFLELRKRLRSGLLIVRKDAALCPAEATVSGAGSSLQIKTSEGDLRLALPARVAVEPGSVMVTSAGAQSEEELHFRLRITVTAQQEAGDSVTETPRATHSYCFHCQSCSTRLLQDRVFRRVLPLPNGNWNAIVDDWCCHPDPFANRTLLPREDDCLLGDTFLLLRPDQSCKDTLREETRAAGAGDQGNKKSCRRLTVVSCQSCCSELGEVLAPEALKLYVTQVQVERGEGDRRPALSRSVFLERVVADKLLELSNSLSTFHFSVQTPGGKAFLLIWLLNSDSMVASAPPGHSDTSSSSSDTSSWSSSGPPGRLLRASSALKLLYISCSDAELQQRQMVRHWEENSVGHPLELPLSVCEELQRVMDQSNATLPSSLRHMQQYQVAYLRLCVPEDEDPETSSD